MLFRDGLEKKFFIHRKRKKTDFYMRQLMNLWKGMASAVAGGLLLCACSAEEEAALAADGKGFVKIGLSADTAFGAATKAVDESAYKNVDDYTVQIWKAGAQVGEDYTYGDIEGTPIELPETGTYTVKAFMGEDVAASRTSLYVVGSDDVTINGNQAENVSIACKPTSAKVTVAFDETMKDYFDNYYVSFKTVALGDAIFPWEKDDKDPVYLKVGTNESVKATIHLTKKDGVKVESTEIEKTYTLSPNTAKTINIKPTLSQGSLGIEITIDDTTNDKEIDIEVPSDWV